jgi:PKD repeat protein
VSYTWDLGDGNTAVGPLVSHTYEAAGTYTATVTAVNSVSSQQAETVGVVEQAAYQLYLPAVIQNGATAAFTPSKAPSYKHHSGENAAPVETGWGKAASEDMVLEGVQAVAGLLRQISYYLRKVAIQVIERHQMMVIQQLNW